MIRKIALTLLAGIVAMHSADAWSQEAPEAVEAVEAVEACWAC
jgi:hypothetical protein